MCCRVIAEELTSFYDDVGMRCERDAFDTLFDHAPDKLQVRTCKPVRFLFLHFHLDLDTFFFDHKLQVKTFTPGRFFFFTLILLDFDTFIGHAHRFLVLNIFDHAAPTV
jgi:hypothetical protein